MCSTSLDQTRILEEVTIDLIQKNGDINPRQPVVFHRKTDYIENILSVISRLYYEKGPTNTSDLAKEIYGINDPRIYEKIIQKHLCSKGENRVYGIRKKRSNYAIPFQKTVNVMQFEGLSPKYYIYPLAIFLKIESQNGNYFIDLTSIDSFNANLDTIAGKVRINICINGLTLKDFLQYYQYADHTDVVKILGNIAKRMPNYTTNLYTEENLRREVDFKLEYLKSFFNLRERYSQNNYFTPRETKDTHNDILEEIHTHLSSRARTSEAIVVLSGLGGVGKTQLAIEYAYRHEKDIKIICWLSAKDLENDYLELKSFLRIPDNEKNNTSIYKIRDLLRTRNDWLLIFDNVFEMADISKFIPRTKEGRIIVTSYRSDWPNVTKHINVRYFTPTEAREYIFKSLYQDKIDKQIYDMDGKYKKMADDLASGMGCLPLALSQACAYIKASENSNDFKGGIDKYLDLFNKSNIDIFKGFGSLKKDYPDYPDTVATTWSISINKIKESDPAAIYLLRLCAFMAPEPLEINLIKKGYKHLPLCDHHEYHQIFCDDLCMQNAILSLRDYSLIDHENGVLSLHRFVQLVTFYSIQKDERSIWLEELVKVIMKVLPNDITTKTNRDIYNHLLPHISNILTLVEKGSVQNENIDNIISLIDKVSTFLSNTSEFKKHIEYQKRKLKLCKRNNDLLGVAKCYTQIGNKYNKLGKYAKDKRCQRLSLETCEKIREHQGANLDVNLYRTEADCHLNLGKANHNLCNFNEAIEDYRKSLAIYERIHDEQGITDCYINLGVAYYRLSHFKKDIECQKKGLKICQGLGDKRRESKCYTNLSNALLVLGEFKQAIEYQTKSYMICKRNGDRQGESTCLNNLGVACHYLVNYEKARDKFMEAIDINEKIGETEGNTKCYGNLGNVFHSQGDYGEAIEKQEYSKNISINLKDRQGISTVNHNLGNIYHSQGDYKKAIDYHTESLEICQDTDDMLGELKCYRCLSMAYDRYGDSENAKIFEEKRRKLYLNLSNLNGGASCCIIPGDVYNRLA